MDSGMARIVKFDVVCLPLTLYLSPFNQDKKILVS